MPDLYRAAFEKVCARMYRDLHFDASESAAPEDERWARTISGFCDFVETLAEQAEAAEPPLTTTAEQLRALPVGTVLLDNGEKIPGPWQVLPRASRRVMATRDENEYDLADTDRIGWLLRAYGPFRVLHTPEVPHA